MRGEEIDEPTNFFKQFVIDVKKNIEESSKLRVGDVKSDLVILDQDIDAEHQYIASAKPSSYRSRDKDNDTHGNY